MSDAEIGLEGAKFFALLAAGILIYMGPFRWARIANWRQDVFAVRNRLWDQMRECGALDEPAHRTLRDIANAMIRNAPVLNLFYLAAVVCWVPAQGAKPVPLRDQVAKVKDPRAVAALNEASRGLVMLFLRQLFLNSFPGIIVGWPLVIAWKLGVFSLISWLSSQKAKVRQRAEDLIDRFGRAATPSRPGVAVAC